MLALVNHDNASSRKYAYLDSGSSRHIVCDPLLFHTADGVITTKSKVIVGNGAEVDSVARGDVPVLVSASGKETEIVLKDCLLVPDLCTNLISVSQLTENELDVQFTESCATIRKDGIELLSLPKVRKLYPAQLHPVRERSLLSLAELWHRRLVHVSDRTRKCMDHQKQICGDVDRCEACELGKSKKNHFPRSLSRSEGILALLHVDLAGPFEKSIKDGRYFMVIVDDHSRYYEIYILKHKSEALAYMQRFTQLHETRTGKKVKCIRSDNGGEFLNDRWDEWLQQKGIRRELTSPYSAQQNGRAERAVGVVKTGATTLLQQAKLPRRYWSSAIRTYAYVRNKLPLSSNPDHIPEAVFLGRPIDYDHLRVFGCVAWCHIPKERRRAMEAKARKCIMIGYGQQDEKGVKGYVLWDPERRRRIITSNVKFWEDRLYHDSIPDDELVGLFDDIDGMPEGGEEAPRMVEVPADEEDMEPEPCDDRPRGSGSYDLPPVQPNPPIQIAAPIPARPHRERRRPTHLDEYETFLASDEHQGSLEDVMDDVTAIAFYSRKHEDYQDARANEVQSMHDHDVWELVPFRGQRLIGNQFLYSEKMDADGEVFKKARLIVHGNTQRPGEDYAISEIFAPVVKLESLRILLAYAVTEGLHLLQGDVKTAYLNSDLKEDVYMRQPKGFEEPGKETYVCKLKKSIYGLHQSARNWYLTMCDKLADIDYHPLVSEPSLFVKKSPTGATIGTLALYVDDLVVAGNHGVLQELRNHLDSVLTMKWNDQPKLLLGLQLEYDIGKGNLRLYQTRYIDEILADYDLTNATPTKTPIYEQFPFNDDCKKAPDRRFPYLECIGKLNWLARGTRPDIAFAVSHLARFCSIYQEQHWNACIHLMKYLKGTRLAYIEYDKKGSRYPVGYSDADWAQNKGDRKSVTGYIFNMADAPVTWSSKGQATVALSSTEAEYVALTATAREAIWLRSVLAEMGRPATRGTTIYEDNESAMKLVNNPVLHARSKHIDICHHAVRQFSRDKKIVVERRPTDVMVADMLTKPVSGRRVRYLADLVGLHLNVQR